MDTTNSTIYLTGASSGIGRAPADALEVVSRCPCGCASIDFSSGGNIPAAAAGMLVLSDYVYGGINDLCGVYVFAKGSSLAGL